MIVLDFFDLKHTFLKQLAEFKINQKEQEILKLTQQPTSEVAILFTYTLEVLNNNVWKSIYYFIAQKRSLS